MTTYLDLAQELTAIRDRLFGLGLPRQDHLKMTPEDLRRRQEEIEKILNVQVPGPDDCVSSAGHSWYRIYWSSKRLRYERECSLMGCSAFQYLDGLLKEVSKVIHAKNVTQKNHGHSWGYWQPIPADTTDDNLFYRRLCSHCGAVWLATDLEAVGTWHYFSGQEAP